MRGCTDSKLTYAANWTDYRRVGFWDALDAIGIQAYFPIADSDRPTDAELRDGWDEVMDEVRTFADGVDKDVVFTELGYNRAWQTARKPWESHTDGPEAEELQARCTTIALGANTDPYQPVERDWRIMRACLEVLAAFNHPVAIVTKGALVERDIDILAPMAAQGLVRVGISVTTLDAALSRRIR